MKEEREREGEKFGEEGGGGGGEEGGGGGRESRQAFGAEVVG